MLPQFQYIIDITYELSSNDKFNFEDNLVKNMLEFVVPESKTKCFFMNILRKTTSIIISCPKRNPHEEVFTGPFIPGLGSSKRNPHWQRFY